MDQTEENGNGKRVLVEGESVAATPRAEENCNRKRVLAEGESIAPPKKSQPIVKVNRSLTDLTFLKKFRDSLNQEDLEAFRARFGKIDDIMDIEIDWDAITAILHFYIPELRCFVFPNFDLTPTIDEYLYMLAPPEGVSPSKVYIPDCSKSPHIRGPGGVYGMMRKLCGIDEKLTKQCLIKNGHATGFSLNWNQIYQELSENLTTLNKQEYRINLLAVGIYGLVLLPTKCNYVDSEVIWLIKQLVEQPEMNVAPAILAETFHTLSYIKKKSYIKGRKGGQMMSSAQLITMWIHGHFPVGNPFYGCCRISSARPAFRFCKIPKKIMPMRDWYKMLYSAKPEDVKWRVGWLCVKEYIAPPKNRNWIPLLGIKGMTSYTPNLVMRQLSNTQGVPNLKEISEPEMKYSELPDVIQEKLTSMAEEWKNCEIKKAEMKLGTTSEYISWRRTWIKDRVIPLPHEIYQPRSSILGDFECQIRQLKQELQMTDERNIQIINDPDRDACLISKILEKLKEDQRKLLELEEGAQKWFLLEQQGESRQDSQEHQGEFENEHQGESGQEHEGETGQEHEGELGQEHKGESGQEHEGETGQEHEGELGQEHKGETGQEHEGETGQEHEGELGQEHEGESRRKIQWLRYIGKRKKSVDELIEELRQEMKTKREHLEKRIQESTVSKKRMKIGS